MKDVYQLADLQNWADATADLPAPIRLGVIGDPVAHSLSPALQNAALEASGLTMQYARFRILPNELEQTFRLMREHDFVGVNLTLPHKMAALTLLDEAADSVREIGACNTVAFRDGRSLGYNSDGEGFSRAVREAFSVDLGDLRVLLLGAGGGAGRAIARQCALEGCERLVLVTRVQAKAEALAKELTGYFSGPRVFGPVPRLEAIPWDDRALRAQLARTDLVVNATPLGLRLTDASPISRPLLAPHLMVYDLIPSDTRTALLVAAAEAGARGSDGRGMLLHQGALAFEFWFDRPAPLAVMRRSLGLS
ncbi:MAG TPA: shikimate dehydrogenase [Chthoniobacterales bacterium]|nr:shikimate dehydrogenase [Chthoniobacterales bacterium]